MRVPVPLQPARCRARQLIVLVALSACAGASVAVAQATCTPRRPMVDAVKFKGNRAVLTSDIAPIIATERTGQIGRAHV